MNSEVQDLAVFLSLLLNNEFDEAGKILALKRSTFKQTEVTTLNALKAFQGMTSLLS